MDLESVDPKIARDQIIENLVASMEAEVLLRLKMARVESEKKDELIQKFHLVFNLLMSLHVLKYAQIKGKKSASPVDLGAQMIRELNAILTQRILFDDKNPKTWEGSLKSFLDDVSLFLPTDFYRSFDVFKEKSMKFLLVDDLDERLQSPAIAKEKKGIDFKKLNSNIYCNKLLVE